MRAARPPPRVNPRLFEPSSPSKQAIPAPSYVAGGDASYHQPYDEYQYQQPSSYATARDYPKNSSSSSAAHHFEADVAAELARQESYFRSLLREQDELIDSRTPAPVLSQPIAQGTPSRIQPQQDRGGYPAAGGQSQLPYQQQVLMVWLRCCGP
jgi:hypothetical protein